jgi:hypothetical protein
MQRLVSLAAAIAALPATAQDLPQPELKLRVDLSSFAPAGAYFRGSSAHFGDLDNDGDARDFVRHVNSNRMQAFRFTGEGVELLWEYEAGFDLPLPSERYFYKYVIWDLDGDGTTELAGAFATEGGMMEMRVLDAATGVVEKSAPLVIANPDTDHRNRALRMKTVVADLAGDGAPSELLLIDERNSDGDFHAFAADLTPLWSTGEDSSKIIPAHYPWAYDLNGDGTDEIVGRYAYGQDGAEGIRLTPELWKDKGDYYDHIDRAVMADFMPDRAGPELAVSYEWTHARVVDPVSGQTLWESPGVHKDAKIIAAGEFFPDSPGMEIVVEWALTDDEKTVVVLSGSGAELLRGDSTFSSGYVIDWDGDRATDEVFETKYGTIVQVATNTPMEIREAYKGDAATAHGEEMRLYMHAVDMLGDYREEIVALDEDELLIYGAAGVAPAKLPSPWDDPRYRLAVANQMSDNHSERPFFDWRSIGASYVAAGEN